MNRNVPFATVEKWRQLTKLIVKLSREGKLSWEETANDNEYLTVFSGYTVSIRSNRILTEYDDETPVVEILISDKSGRVVEKFNDEDIKEHGEHNEYYEALTQLMMEVQRELSGADAILDDLLSKMTEQSNNQ